MIDTVLPAVFVTYSFVPSELMAMLNVPLHAGNDTIDVTVLEEVLIVETVLSL
jgi:hypothetical protein